MDVKFLHFRDDDDRKVRRFQYTAIDDATRIRALRVYNRHTQKNAVNFVNYVLEKFPFRIHTIRTDNGHEFQARFHWHVEDLGIRHVYIKPRSPHLNGKVARSHLTDEREYYQLLSYTSDVDLSEKLSKWEFSIIFTARTAVWLARHLTRFFETNFSKTEKCQPRFGLSHVSISPRSTTSPLSPTMKSPRPCTG